MHSEKVQVGEMDEDVEKGEVEKRMRMERKVQMKERMRM